MPVYEGTEALTVFVVTGSNHIQMVEEFETTYEPTFIHRSS